MQHPPVIKQHHIALLPIMRIHQLGTNTGPLQPMHNLPHSHQLINHFATLKMDPPYRRRMDLQRQPTRDVVLPNQRQDLHFRRIDRREKLVGEFKGVGDEAEAVGAGFGAAHPDVRVRGVFDAAGAGELLVRGGEEVEHFVSACKGRGAERDVQLVARAVVVAQRLAAALWDRDREEGCHFRGVEIVEGGVDVPAVEARVGEVVVGGNGVFVEVPVVRVRELDVGEAFVFGHEAVAEDLDFGLVRDGFQVGVQDAAFGVEGLAVAVAGGGGVEAVGQFVLGFG